MSRPHKLLFPTLLALLLASCGGGDKTNTADIRVTCLGSACAAGGVESYANGAAQVWTYQNTSDTPVTLDLNFSNLAQGQELAYVFGNGYSADINSLPSPGQPSTADGSAGKTTVGSSTQPELSVRDPLQESHDEWRHRQQGRDAETSRLLRARWNASSAQTSTSAAPAAASVSVSGSSTIAQRSWVDSTAAEAKGYATSARSSCLAGNGRQVVIWADDSALSRGIVNSTSLAAIGNTLCGSNGAVARMSKLIGNVWGPVTDDAFIRDDINSLLDINVAIISAGKAQPWAGYFAGRNTLVKSLVQDSNEALVFFINADQMEGHLEYTLSTLIHELTHMVYWYERSVARNAPPNDTWLEEMAALMSEDILTPMLVSDANGQPYRPVTSYRLPAYISSGGGLNLVSWAPLERASPYYSMAAAFGAYLNRQYGLAIYKGLVKDCNAIADSWSCLDTVVKKNGGKGVDEEFNRFGLTVFGLADGNGPSARYSFPTRVDDAYVMTGINLSDFRRYRPSRSPDVATWATGTHSYFVEATNISIFSFTRRGITVPARSRLNIMIRQPSGS